MFKVENDFGRLKYLRFGHRLHSTGRAVGSKSAEIIDARIGETETVGTELNSPASCSTRHWILCGTEDFTMI
jgi:hypothetical protein